MFVAECNVRRRHVHWRMLSRNISSVDRPRFAACARKTAAGSFRNSISHLWVLTVSTTARLWLQWMSITVLAWLWSLQANRESCWQMSTEEADLANGLTIKFTAQKSCL